MHSMSLQHRVIHRDSTRQRFLAVRTMALLAFTTLFAEEPLAQVCVQRSDFGVGTALSSDPQASRTWPGGRRLFGMPRCRGRWFFTAKTQGTGYELYATDGTTAGTTRVADVRPGPASSSPQRLTTVVVNAVEWLVFSADDGVHGREPWVSDGTAAGTRMLRDIQAGAAGSEPNHFTAVNGLVVFAATEAASGTELWRSDLSASGTFLLSDIEAGPASSSPQRFLAAPGGAFAFFAAREARVGLELWRSDGSVAGTRVVRDLNPRSGDGLDAHPLAAMALTQNGVVFAGNDGSTGFEPWFSDGTVLGTKLLVDVSPGPTSTALDFEYAATFGARVAFAATTPALGPEPWISDGTTNGTRLLADLVPGTEGSYPREFCAAGTKLFFQARTPATGYELFCFDGSGVRLVADLRAGFESSYPMRLSTFGQSIVFMPTVPRYGAEPWISDGTTAGTRLLRDISRFSSQPSILQDIGGRVLFGADDVGSPSPTFVGRELWTSDGTTAGTQLLADIERSSISPGGEITEVTPAFGRQLFCQAQDPDFGLELFSMDRASVFSRQSDINFGPAPADIRDLTLCNAALFFSAVDGQGRELHVFDGQSLTRFDLERGAGSSDPSDFVVLDGRQVLFTAATAATGRELYRADPDGKNAALLVDLRVGSASSNPRDLVVSGGYVYFAATDASGDRELWRSDGTAAGTQRAVDIWPGATSSSPEDLQSGFDSAGQPRLWMRASRPAEGTELAHFDGTTLSFVDVLPGSASSDPRGMCVREDRVYFAAQTAQLGREPFVSDGTNAGTTLLADVHPGPASSDATSFTVTDGAVFFTADDGVTGRELHAHDPRSLRTQRVADIELGAAASDPGGLVAVADRVYFAATRSDVGRELFVSDGTATGTRLVCDEANPGAASAAPREVTVHGRDLFFVADTAQSGKGELFSIACPTALVQRVGDGCGGIELSATAPKRGGTMQVLAQGAQLRDFGLVALAVDVAVQPLPAAPLLAPGCFLHVDLPVVAVFPIGVGARVVAPLVVPNDRALLCQSFALQTLHYPLLGTLTLRSSNGLLLTIGD